MPENRDTASTAAINQTIALVLGGGMGKRLYPLTRNRSKPAVPFAGNYRIIDIPISNCIHSAINRIFVLTQYNSASLNRHIVQTYKFDIFHHGFVEILAAEETVSNSLQGFSHGTAQAVRDAIHHLQNHHNVKYVLILAGDQLYQMDFHAIFEKHLEHDADVTLGVLPISRHEAMRFGIVHMDSNGLIKDFLEKPDPSHIDKSWSSHNDEISEKCFASMNMYLFKKEVLMDVLKDHPQMIDFGKEIIPHIVHENKIYGSIHNGYWEDIGTLSTFHAANLTLTEDLPSFNIYDKHYHFFSHPRFLPPSKIQNTTLNKVLVSDGSILTNCYIESSVIGVRSVIGSGCHIDRSVIMGNDYYETIQEQKEQSEKNIPLLGIGRDCRIHNAIIDKNCRIGNNVIIANDEKKADGHYEQYSIQGDLIVIPKNTILPDNTII